MIATFRLPAMLARAAFVTAVAIAAGCSFTREAPIKQIYLIDAPLPPAAAQAHEGALRVGAVRVGAPFRGKNIVVREGDLRYQNDFYVEFLVPPGPMLNEQTARAMSAAKVFTRVVPPGAYGQADYVLEGFVSELYGDVHTGTPAAVVTVTYYSGGRMTRARCPSGRRSIDNALASMLRRPMPSPRRSTRHSARSSPSWRKISPRKACPSRNAISSQTRVAWRRCRPSHWALPYCPSSCARSWRSARFARR